MPDFIQNIDWTILNSIRDSLSCGFLDAVMPVITKLGDAGVVWIIAGVTLLFFKKYRRYGIILLAALAVDFLLGELLLKHLIARPRPFVQAGVPIIIGAPSGYSFPSGHTSVAASAAVILTAASRRFGFAAIPLAALIAFSRLYLYVHFPSDVLAGALFGLIMGFAAVLVCRRLSARGNGAAHGA